MEWGMFPGGEVGPGFPGLAISAFVLGLGGGVGTGCRVLGGLRLQAHEHKRLIAAHNALQRTRPTNHQQPRRLRPCAQRCVQCK